MIEFISTDLRSNVANLGCLDLDNCAAAGIDEYLRTPRAATSSYGKCYSSSSAIEDGADYRQAKNLLAGRTALGTFESFDDQAGDNYGIEV